MKEKTPSGNAMVLMVILTILFAAAILIGPTLYADAHGIETNTAKAIPEIGTYEYELWCQQFAEQHGREYNINDALIATKNGAHLLAGYIGICSGFFLLCYTIWDVGRWAIDRKAYLNHETNERPRPGYAQAVRTGIHLIIVIAFSSLYFAAPYLMTPISIA